MKTTNLSDRTSFGSVPLIPKLRHFYSFFPNLKAIFFIFCLPSSTLMLFLPFLLCLLVSLSLSLTFGILVSISHSCGFSPHGLTSGVISPSRVTVSISHHLTLRSHRRLSLLLTISPLLAISPLPHFCYLTATTRPRSLSPTDPAKGHGTPIKLSLSLSLSHYQILVY